MAIHFACPWCTQTISVDESKARERVECPHCNRPVKVPPKSTEDPPPVSQLPSVTAVKQEQTPQATAIPATAATAVSKTEPLTAPKRSRSAWVYLIAGWYLPTGLSGLASTAL